MSRQSRVVEGRRDCTSSPSHLSLARHSPARASNGGQTRVTSTQRRREDVSKRRTMGDRGGTGGGRPRARGEDPTATAFNPLYAGRSAGAASRGRGAGTEGKKGSEAEVWSDEELIYAEVFSARFGSADGGRERRCSSAELCGYLICPLTAVGLALGALVLAVLLLRGVLTPLELSKVPRWSCARPAPRWLATSGGTTVSLGAGRAAGSSGGSAAISGGSAALSGLRGRAPTTTCSESPLTSPWCAVLCCAVMWSSAAVGADWAQDD